MLWYNDFVCRVIQGKVMNIEGIVRKNQGIAAFCAADYLDCLPVGPDALVQLVRNRTDHILYQCCDADRWLGIVQPWRGFGHDAHG